jgi:anthranilate synthase component 2
MRVLLIDNYDSFTYNLVHYLEPYCELEVWKNDQIIWNRISTFDAFVISPGPGIPKSSGDLLTFISTVWDEKPMLGVCLGMQAMAEHTNMNLVKCPTIIQGKPDRINILLAHPFFSGFEQSTTVARYHSWKINFTNDCWDLVAESEDGTPMAISHNTLPHFAVQFHPESIMTINGKMMIKNWINYIKKFV